jgi:hypothetical protein
MMKTEKLIAALILLIVVGYLVERHNTDGFTVPPPSPATTAVSTAVSTAASGR